MPTCRRCLIWQCHCQPCNTIQCASLESTSWTLIFSHDGIECAGSLDQFTASIYVWNDAYSLVFLVTGILADFFFLDLFMLELIISTYFLVFIGFKYLKWLILT